MISGFSMDEPRIKVKVSEIRCETGNVKTFKLILAEGEIVFTPGQFVMLYAKIDGEEVGRAYSIASSPLDKGSIELTIELTPDGRLTPFFHKKVEVGDVVIFEGNYKNPIIHRVVKIKETSEGFVFSTMGDNNNGQLEVEKEISQEQIMGKAQANIAPYVGWIKLIFFERKSH